MSKHDASMNSRFFLQPRTLEHKVDKPFQTLMIVLGNILEGFNILKNVAEFKILGSLGLFMGFVCFWLGFFCFFLVFVDLVYKINFETFSFQQLFNASFVQILASKCEN